MEKNQLLVLILSLCALSGLLSEITSKYIGHVYKKNADHLPVCFARTPKLRRIFLALTIFMCGALLVAKATALGTIPLSTVAPLKTSPPDLAAFLCLIPGVFLLLVITVTDWEHRIIFDDTTLPLAIFGLLRTLAASCAAASCTPLLENLAASVGGGICFLILAMITRGGIGGGDIKLIAALGWWLGPARLSTVIYAGLFLGGLVAIFHLVVKRKKSKDTFAYGPCFTLPAILLLLA